MDSGISANQPKKSLSLKLDYRVIIGVLLIVIVAMVLLWRPWEPRFDADARTISVFGEAKVTAAPDEYTFTPMYEFQNADRDAALAELSKKSDEIVAKLKELGVTDASIKTNSDGYDYPGYPMDEKPDSGSTYSLRLTVTVNDKEIADKVQNYLVGTAPTGAVSPQFGFSDAKQKELESKARDEATKDARSKAEQSAKNLGFSIGGVKEVTDGASSGGIPPMFRGGIDIAGDSATSQELGIQPGENELTYQMSVVYFVK